LSLRLSPKKDKNQQTEVSSSRSETLRPRRAMKMLSEDSITKENFLYTVSLQELIKKNKNPDVPVPDFLVQIYNYLIQSDGIKEEGIFRISPFGGLLDEIKWILDKGISVNFTNYKGFNCHAASGLLKMWLRSLPEPLIPFSFYESIISIYEIHDDIILHSSLLSELLHTLPTPNRLSLQLLIHLLFQVKQNSDLNKMNSTNLAVVFAPCLMRNKDLKGNPLKDFNEIPKIISTIQIIIDFYPIIFPDELPSIILNPQIPVNVPEKFEIGESSSESSTTLDEENTGIELMRNLISENLLINQRGRDRSPTISDPDFDLFLIDSQNESPVVINQEDKIPNIPTISKKSSMIFKNISEIFYPDPKKEELKISQNRKNRTSFVNSSVQDNSQQQPSSKLNENHLKSKISEEHNAKKSHPNSLTSKEKSRSMSFFVS